MLLQHHALGLGLSFYGPQSVGATRRRAQLRAIDWFLFPLAYFVTSILSILGALLALRRGAQHAHRAAHRRGDGCERDEWDGKERDSCHDASCTRPSSTSTPRTYSTSCSSAPAPRTPKLGRRTSLKGDASLVLNSTVLADHKWCENVILLLESHATSKS
ncbi:hypothetical protein DFH09DRAFT_1096443 [Mycena vulgaris]|nr:hypothetical protein DFH09DRAFT_1096443 [Mycena vulgaris]